MPARVAQRLGQPGRGFLRRGREPLGGGAATVERRSHDDGGVDAASCSNTGAAKPATSDVTSPSVEPQPCSRVRLITRASCRWSVRVLAVSGRSSTVRRYSASQAGSWCASSTRPADVAYRGRVVPTGTE